MFSGDTLPFTRIMEGTSILIHEVLVIRVYKD